MEPVLLKETDLMLSHAIDYLLAQANNDPTEAPRVSAGAVELIAKAMLALPMPRWAGQTEHLTCLIDTCRQVQSRTG